MAKPYSEVAIPREQARNRPQVGSAPLITRTLHFAVRRSRPGATGLINRFNDELPRIVADRTYHRPLHLGWIQADVDGDGRQALVARTDRVGQSLPTAVTISS